MSKPEFTLLQLVTVKLLSLLTSANSTMHGKSCNIMLAVELLSSANAAIKQLRSDAQFEEFAAEDEKDDQPRVLRTRRQNKFLTNYLVTLTLDQNNGNDNMMSNRDIQKQTGILFTGGVCGRRNVC